MKQLLVETNLARRLVRANAEKIMAIKSRSRQPNLPAHDGWCGPPTIGYLRFPFHVLRLAPPKRQADRVSVARSGNVSVTPGPAKSRPVPQRSHAPSEENQARNDSGQ